MSDGSSEVEQLRNEVTQLKRQLEALGKQVTIPPGTTDESGLIGLFLPYIKNCFSGFGVGKIWRFGVDFEGEDFVLYCCDTACGYPRADILRISLNRRFHIGWYAPTPKNFPATWTVSVNPGDKVGLHLKTPEKLFKCDAIRIEKRNTADWMFIHFTQGDGLWDIRVGFNEGSIHVFSANGEAASAEFPGREIAKLDRFGNLWLRGIVKENTLP